MQKSTEAFAYRIEDDYRSRVQTLESEEAISSKQIHEVAAAGLNGSLGSQDLPGTPTG